MNILFLKEEKKLDPYRTLFEDHGYQVSFETILETQWMNLETCKGIEALDFDGIVVTSQRAVEAIRLSGMCANQWKSAFCVGEATASALTSLGFSAIGKEAGSASALGPIIVHYYQRNAFSKPLLYLVGDKTLSTLGNHLSQESIPFHTMQVYRTENVKKIISCSGYLVVFSPSGLDSIDVTSSPIFVAIGPTTSLALTNRGIPHITASSPKPQGVLEAILNSKI
jgi:uroporphyrinogen-III synthase